MMVREFNESRLSRDAYGYFAFSMKCSLNNDIFVHFRAVVCNGRVCSLNADFVHPAMSPSCFAEENRHFLRKLNLYLRTGLCAVKEEEAIEARLDL